MKKSLLFFVLITALGCSDDANWTYLFNGEDLNGWHVYLQGDDSYNGWYVADGVLVYDPSRRTDASNADLVSDEQYMSFELDLEWMISEEGNSGIFWSVVEDERYEHTYDTGPEIQVLDDGWQAYLDERGDIQRAGSIFNVMAPSQVVSKPAGEWNHVLLHIDHAENQGFMKFNGIEVLRFPVHGPEWEQMIADSPFKGSSSFGKVQTGHIAFQDHGSQVAYRNIKIREL